ncbi:unnamed protein product [Dicrocoelium dendriticum]|nr:unnamed protein product [Dicrocoelium dendriticum]
MVYAHRIYESLMVQNFLVYNPLDEDVTVKLNKAHIKNLKGIKTIKMINLKQKNLPTDTASRDVAYQVISVLLDEDASGPDSEWEYSTRRVIVVVLFEPVFPDAFTVPAGRIRQTLVSGR